MAFSKTAVKQRIILSLHFLDVFRRITTNSQQATDLFAFLPFYQHKINNFYRYTKNRIHGTIYHAEFTKSNKFYKNQLQKLKVCLRGKRCPWVRVTYFKSLQRILMKPHIFTTFGIINRAVRFIFCLSEKIGKAWHRYNGTLFLRSASEASMHDLPSSCIYSYNLAQELPNGPVHNALKVSRCIWGTDRMLAKTDESQKSGRIIKSKVFTSSWSRRQNFAVRLKIVNEG